MLQFTEASSLYQAWWRVIVTGPEAQEIIKTLSALGCQTPHLVLRTLRRGMA